MGLEAVHAARQMEGSRREKARRRRRKEMVIIPIERFYHPRENRLDTVLPSAYNPVRFFPR